MNKNINFKNVGCFKETEEGTLLYRYPEAAIAGLGYKDSVKGKEKAMVPAMVEIRVLSYATELSITLKALDSHMKVFCYIDDFQNGEAIVNEGESKTLEFKVHERLQKLYPEVYGKKPYLWRIILGNGSRVVFKNLEAGELLPFTPALPWVSYGSSISQGAGALDIVNCYIFLTQQALKTDILNKGLSGSCLLEKSAVDYLASIPCKGYILEIGANVRGIMDGPTFEQAFDYLMDTLSKKNCPILLISILDMFEKLYENFSEVPYHEKNAEFIEIIKKKIIKMNNKNIHLVSSADWMLQIEGISADMLHPSNLGHALLANGLTTKIKSL